VPQSEILLLILFNVFIAVLLAVDLGVFNRKAHAISIKEAIIWSIVWTVLALVFNAGIFVTAGHIAGLEFFTGYLIERALSFDNIFVFVVIFSYFGVPAQYHHKALFWGVVGALVTRSLFIGAGVALIMRFEWVLYVFGVILIVSGWKMFSEKEAKVHPDRNLFIRAARKVFPVSAGYESARFFLVQHGKLFLTPLFLVVVTLETTDIVFALDSIPAVFGVTRDPFIVYSSNIFAILGLRATYFLLAGIMNTFYYLSHGLAIVLIFIGVKMILADLFPISIMVSLAVIGGVLTAAVFASIIRKRRSGSAK